MMVGSILLVNVTDEKLGVWGLYEPQPSLLGSCTIPEDRT